MNLSQFNINFNRFLVTLPEEEEDEDDDDNEDGVVVPPGLDNVETRAPYKFATNVKHKGMTTSNRKMGCGRYNTSAISNKCTFRHINTKNITARLLREAVAIYFIRPLGSRIESVVVTNAADEVGGTMEFVVVVMDV